MASPKFRVEFDPEYGKAVEIAEGVQRITCPNKGPFTFHGTNTYLVGQKAVGLIDPGPLNDTHEKTIMEALKGRELSHVIVTHTHVDHSSLATKIARLTGVPIYAEGPHRAARDLHIGEINHLDASGDKEFEPDVIVSHGEKIVGLDWQLSALFTPGHTANHMAFALDDTPFLFSGDHVMGWATSIVAPPDGSMSDYMASLDVLGERPESVYFPGHGGRMEKAREFVRALRAHRKMRETAILSRIRKGDRTIPQIVSVIYKDTDKRLHGAAALSVLAHIEDLLARGMIASDGPASIEGEYEPVAVPTKAT